MNAQLQLSDVSIAYAGTEVVHQASFQLKAGELGCLLGPSGCGKSTLLRAIAGFEPITSGRIELHGKEVSRVNHTQPPEKRKVGMVFQDFALFPHLTIGKNIAFGLKGQSRAKQTARIRELLELVGLSNIEQSYPHQLSGGQQQRVALARALAPRPEILLLDEPFSSLDAELREQLALDLRQSLQQEGVTGLMVTHDQEEALTVADHIGILRDGQLLQWDTPYHIYHEPRQRFVAEFIGRGVFAAGIMLENHKVATELGQFTISTGQQLEPNSPVDVLLRPDDIIASEAGPIKGTVTDRRYHGAEYLYTVRLGGKTDILCFAPSHFPYEIGEEIGLTPALSEVVIFPNRESEP